MPEASLWALVILWALAAQRLAFLWLTQEVFASARHGLSWLHPKMQYLLNCPICMNVWCSAIVLILWHVSWLGQVIVLSLAIATAVVCVSACINVVELLALRMRGH